MKPMGTREGDEDVKKGKSSKTFVNILKSKRVYAREIITNGNHRYGNHQTVG